MHNLPVSIIKNLFEFNNLCQYNFIKKFVGRLVVHTNFVIYFYIYVIFVSLGIKKKFMISLH